MGAYDDHIAVDGNMGTSTEFHLPLESDATDALGNVTATVNGSPTFGGAATISGIGSRAGRDTGAATALNGSTQGIVITDSIADTIIDNGGWTAGWFRSSVEQTDAPMLMSFGNSSSNNLKFWMFISNVDTFKQDFRVLRILMSNDANTNQVGIDSEGLRGIHPIAETPLGAFVVVSNNQVNGTTWRIRVWVNGNLDIDAEYTKSGNFTPTNIAFGQSSRTTSGNFFQGDMHKISAGLGEPTDAQVRAAFEAGRGITDSDYLTLAPGGIVESTTFDATEATIIPVNLTVPARILPVFVYPDAGGTNSMGVFTSFAPTKPGSGIRALSSGNDSEMFGQGGTDAAGNVVKTHMGWAHDDEAYQLDAGKHLLHFHHYADNGTPGPGTLAKVYAHASLGEDIPVTGTVNAYSSPIACEYDGTRYWVDSEVGSDARWIFDSDGNARRLRGGFRANDINHAGGFCLALPDGVLACAVGHNDAQLHCYYFAGGDITATPTASYTVGTTNSRWSYPQAKVITGTTVGVLVRGTVGDGTAGADPSEHASVFWQFNGTSGASASAKVIYDTDDGARDGQRAYSIGWDIQSDGTDTLIGFVHNFRDWSDDRPSTILAVIWDYTNDTWHLLNGDVINIANTGTAQGTGAMDSPIVPTAIIGQKLTAASGSRGPLLIADTDLSVNTLHVPDADAFAFDLTGGLSDAKLFTLYTAADQASGGGYVDAPWYTLTYDGTTLRPTETANIRGGNAIGTFNSAACSWKDGTVGGTLRIGILNRTQITLTGFGTEVSSPYYEGWGGGDKYTCYETKTPFVSEPIASATIVAQADTASDKMLSQIGIVDGLPNSFNVHQGVQRGHATKQHKHIHIVDDTRVQRLVDGFETSSTIVPIPTTGVLRSRERSGSRVPRF